MAVFTAVCWLSAFVIEPAISDGGNEPGIVPSAPRRETPLVLLRRSLTGRIT